MQTHVIMCVYMYIHVPGLSDSTDLCTVCDHSSSCLYLTTVYKIDIVVRNMYV